MANLKSIDDDREKYQAYLCSRQWAERRQMVLKRAADQTEGKCERCLVMPASYIHHITYARKYNEPISDLMAICEPCHKYIHAKHGQDPREVMRPMRIGYPGTGLCDEGNELLCPVCGFEYTHIEKVTHTDGEDNYKADWCGRGELITIEMSCESCHTFEMCFGFHKGNVTAFTRRYSVDREWLELEAQT